MFKKRRLHRMKLAVFFETFNRRDRISLMHDGESQAGIYSSAIHMDGARAALAMVTTFLGAEELKIFAKRIEQCHPRLQPYPVLGAIDFQHHGHGASRFWGSWRRRRPALLGIPFAKPRACRYRHPSHAPLQERTPGDSQPGVA